MKKFYVIINMSWTGHPGVPKKYDSKQEAIEAASRFMAQNKEQSAEGWTIFESICLVGPEEPPITITEFK